MTGIVCFLRDETTGTRWRFVATSRPVIEFCHAESRRLGTRVYSAQTPMFGGHVEIAKLKRYFAAYDLGDGWYGPLSGDQMRAIANRIRKETAAFLETERFESPPPGPGPGL